MEEIRRSSGVVGSRKLERSDALVKKDSGNESMFEGKNIHSSPIDGKLLCSYSEKLCKQRRLNGYAFCIRHVLEDKNAPFKQCQYVAKYNGQQCTNPIPFPEDRIYCNSHLQVLGLVPKKTRRKKASESQDSVDKDTTHTMRDSSQPRADVSIPDHQKMAFISPVVHQQRYKKQKIKVPKKDPDIPAISELKECLKTSKRDREDLFESYEIDSSDSDSSDTDCMPWQQVWLQPHQEETQSSTSARSDIKNAVESRTAKISKLSSRLRRELHQLRRSLRFHRYRHPLVLSTAAALLKAAQRDVSASVDSVIETSKPRTSPPTCVIKKCSFALEGISCDQNAMPYTKYCRSHIINDNVQVLYSQCTAKWPGGLQCSVPVFDIVHERPLCQEHARKKERFQEAQAAAVESNKQQIKKPRKKPQAKLNVEPKTKKPSNRKPPSKPTKSKSAKEVSKASPLNSSFSPNTSTAVFSPTLDMQMSDYSHTSDHSPDSPKLGDLSQFESSLFESQQQDHLLIPDMVVEELPSNLTTMTNGINSDEKLFEIDSLKKSRPEKTAIWMPPSSIPASVITARDNGKTNSLLNSSHMDMPMLNSENTSKPSPLNSAKRTSKTAKNKKSVRRDAISPIHGIISPTLLQSNHLSNGTSMTFNDDPMFSSPQEILSSEIKPHGNGLPSDHLSHSGMAMDSVLSSPHKSWSSVSNTTNGTAYTSPLNSQNSLSRISSPPFSRVSLSSLSPHLSPNSSHSSVFTFERTSHYQQSSILSPTLSPVSPSYLNNTPLKHSVFQQRDLDSSRSDDPFLTPVEEQPLLGVPFHQSNDSSLGDLRLR